MHSPHPASVFPLPVPPNHHLNAAVVVLVTLFVVVFPLLVEIFAEFEFPVVPTLVAVVEDPAATDVFGTVVDVDLSLSHRNSTELTILLNNGYTTKNIIKTV